MTSLSDFKANTLTGQEQDLASYAGKVVLVVNTASQCGLTPQFSGLESVYEKYVDQGLVILGFPCNQFAGQEPNDSEGIGDFCTKNYGVTFPMFEKIEVNGDEAHPLYQWLKSEKGGALGSAIKWNFTKFLIGKDGQVIKRFSPTTAPEKLIPAIEKALAS
ncbi:MAG: glutathione peroxidase [Marmoricola sp.]